MRINSTRRLFRLLTAASALALCAAAAQAETLTDALIAAYESSPELAASRADLRTLDERVAQARAGFRPNAQLQGSYEIETSNRDFGGRTQFQETTNTDDPIRLQLDASQPLYDGGQTDNRVAAAIADVEAARARLQNNEQDILLATVTAYSDVVRDRDFVAFAENNVRLIAEERRAASDRFDVGEVTLTDVRQAEARLAASRSTLAARRGSLERSYQAYRRVTGYIPVELADAPPLPDLPASLEEAVAISLDNHPDMRAASFDREAADSAVRAEIGGLLPQLTLQGQLAYDSSVRFNATSDQSSASVGVVLTVPLFEGGANYSRVREAQARVGQRSSQIQSVARSLREDVGIAWADLEVARAAISAGRAEVKAASVALEGVREEAKVGARTTLDVLNAEQEVLDARSNLSAALRDEYVAAYTVLEAVGMLSVAHLNLGIEPYDPTPHYTSVQKQLFGYERDDSTEWRNKYKP